MKVELDLRSTDLGEALQVGLLQAMTPELKDALIGAAVQTLITPPPNEYGRKQLSPLQDAFNSAIYAVARTVVEEAVNTPEVQAQITGLVREALQKAVFAEPDGTWNEARNALINNLAGGIAEAFKNTRG
jgi:hypothetical protein